jgi:hypothetical protein
LKVIIEIEDQVHHLEFIDQKTFIGDFVFKITNKNIHFYILEISPEINEFTYYVLIAFIKDFGLVLVKDPFAKLSEHLEKQIENSFVGHRIAKSIIISGETDKEK